MPCTGCCARWTTRTGGAPCCAVGFCRLVANRAAPAELDLHIAGDAGRAAGVLAAASALALD